MNVLTDILQDFKKAFLRINTNESEYVSFVETYIVKELPHKEQIQLIRNTNLSIPITEQSLKKEMVLIQTIKILALMEISDNMQEFEQNHRKLKSRKKKNDKPLNDFDKILKGIMKVPKPDEKEKAK